MDSETFPTGHALAGDAPAFPQPDARQMATSQDIPPAPAPQARTPAHTNGVTKALPAPVTWPEELFPNPDATKRLAGEEYGLPAGQWLDVVAQPWFGMEVDLQAAIIGRTVKVNSPDMEVNWEMATFSKLRAWLKGWSLTMPDPNDPQPDPKLRRRVPVPIDMAHLRGMDPRVAASISAAVDQHIRELQEGNAPGPSSNGSTSP